MKFAININGSFVEEITQASSAEDAIEQFKQRNSILPTDKIEAEEIEEAPRHEK